MSDLVYIPDVREQMLSRLLSQFRDKPRFRALIEGLSAGAQACETLNFELIVSRSLDASTGAQLRQYARLVGEDPGDLSDPDLRRFILARILANTCDSNTDPLIEIWRIIVGPNAFVRHRYMHPMGFQMEAIRSSFMTAPIRRRVRRIMEDVRPISETMFRVEGVIGGCGLSDNFATPYNDGLTPAYTGLNAGPMARSF